MSNEFILDGPEPQEDGPNSGLSYLDIVTAAFGSAIFLLFVFATLPLDQAGGAGSDQYIDVQVHYTGSVDVELQVARNGQLVFRTLDPAFRPDPRTGASRLPDTDDYYSVHISNAAASRSGTQFIGFRIIGPSEGKWSVYVNAAGHLNPFGAPVEEFLVSVATSCASPCVPTPALGQLAGGQHKVRIRSSGHHSEVVSFPIAKE